MENKILEFIGLIYRNYGQIGCLAFLMIIVSILALAFYLLNLLPEPKKIIIWSKCFECKHKHRNYNVFVSSCPKYEKPKWNQLKSPPCPVTNNEGCKVIYNLSSPAVLKREDVPEGMI